MRALSADILQDDGDRPHLPLRCKSTAPVMLKPITLPTKKLEQIRLKESKVIPLAAPKTLQPVKHRRRFRASDTIDPRHIMPGVPVERQGKAATLALEIDMTLPLNSSWEHYKPLNPLAALESKPPSEPELTPGTESFFRDFLRMPSFDWQQLARDPC